MKVLRISRRPDAEQFNPKRFELPRALEQYDLCLAAPHFCLLGDSSDMKDIADAFDKVSKLSAELRE